ncbi:LuxR C-terminal-related transcriptional regulator [Streptosporangium sp. NPDC050855]|uniref:helix-turn-helix transcriptional regulator n=1 Tax=Streptosporangium sp. NPDC050855 TaxID=3366194 RepID=UPI00378CF4EF
MHHAEPNASGDRVITLQELRDVFHRMAESRCREVLAVLSEDPLGRFLSERVGELRAAENRSVSVVRAETAGPAPDSPADRSRVRTLPSVPLSALITDRRTALLCLRTPPGEEAGPVALVTRPGHVSTLVSVFDHLWGSAYAPPPEGASPDGRPQGRCRAVLDLLAEGLTDNAVAARLGIAERTVRREVNGLMQSAGATSRFQLALRAQELGWLRRPAGETRPQTGPEAGPAAGRVSLSHDRG